MSRIDLVSPLSADACVARLSDACDPDTLGSRVGGERPFIVSISGRRVRLRRRRAYRNSFAPIASFTIDDSPMGSTLRGSVGMHLAVRLFLVLWLGGVGFVVVGAVVGLVVGLANGRPLLDVLGPVMVGFLMATFGVALVLVGRRMGRSEERDIRALLAERLEAEVDTSVVSQGGRVG